MYVLTVESPYRRARIMSYLIQIKPVCKCQYKNVQF